VLVSAALGYYFLVWGRRPASLVVNVDPRDARVVVDDRLTLPAGAATGKLTPGPHVIEVSKDGYVPVLQVLEARAGHDIYWLVKLERLGAYGIDHPALGAAPAPSLPAAAPAAPSAVAAPSGPAIAAGPLPAPAMDPLLPPEESPPEESPLTASSGRPLLRLDERPDPVAAVEPAAVTMPGAADASVPAAAAVPPSSQEVSRPVAAPPPAAVTPRPVASPPKPAAAGDGLKVPLFGAPRIVAPTVLDSQRVSGTIAPLPTSVRQAAHVALGRQPGTLATLLKVCVGMDGQVSSAAVLRPSGAPELDAYLHTSILGWRYRPYVQGGKPVPMCAAKMLTIRLD
jgi:hypothetical protein